VFRRVRAPQAREFRVNRGAGRGGTLENARFLFGANVACNFIALVVRGAYWTLQRPGQKSVKSFFREGDWHTFKSPRRVDCLIIMPNIKSAHS
jgi:hypothetical protein